MFEWRLLWFLNIYSLSVKLDVRQQKFTRGRAPTVSYCYTVMTFVPFDFLLWVLKENLFENKYQVKSTLLFHFERGSYKIRSISSLNSCLYSGNICPIWGIKVIVKREIQLVKCSAVYNTIRMWRKQVFPGRSEVCMNISPALERVKFGLNGMEFSTVVVPVEAIVNEDALTEATWEKYVQNLS